MFTIFTIPKPFTNELIATIQTNAIKSWLQLSPTPEIILFGNEVGVAEIAKEYNLTHVPDLECNDQNTPYLDYIFRYAEQNAKYDTLCYINCDIILFQDVIETIKSLKQPKYMLVGQRWDIDITNYIDFTDTEWAVKLNALVDTNGILKASAGSDYFIYKKSTPVNMPKFLIGREGWDNWMIFVFMERKIPVIDSTYSIKDIHQNHDYSHIKGGTKKSYAGKESGYNLNIIKNSRVNRFTPADSYFTLDKCQLNKRKLSFKKKIHHLYCLHPLMKKIINFFVYWLLGYAPRHPNRSLVDYKFAEIDDSAMKDLFMQTYNAEYPEYIFTNKLGFFKRRKLVRFLLKNNIV